jgi:NAD(P)H-binding
MTNPKTLVTAATGKTGGAVIAQLHEKGYPVRAIVRSRDARSKRLDRLGIETVVADMFDPDQMLDAMRGTQRAYYLPFFHPYMIFWMFRKVAQQQRVDPLLIGGFRYYVEEMKRGTFELEGGVTNVVEELTGTPSESFEVTARRYAALPFAKQTVGNRLKAFINFNLIPFYPGYNLDRLDRQKGLPMPPNPSFSIDDDRWRFEHSLQNAR